MQQQNKARMEPALAFSDRDCQEKHKGDREPRWEAGVGSRPALPPLPGSPGETSLALSEPQDLIKGRARRSMWSLLSVILFFKNLILK